MGECTHDCSSCNENCGERKIQKEKLNEFSKVKKIIGVVSGKGGVGKSLVTSLLAVAMQRRGKRTAILDADITGPSIPKLFGLKERAQSVDGKYLQPAISDCGTQVMSINLLLENDTDPVVWRGPVIAGVVKQFYTDVLWNDVDYMFVDMPPGTGDVPLTVFQSLPIDGIIIVTSPQKLVSMVVAKAVNMARLMNVPIFGIIENMSYLECPDCKSKIDVFGKSDIEDVARDFNIEALAKLPIVSSVADICDEGKIEQVDEQFVSSLDEILKKL